MSDVVLVAIITGISTLLAGLGGQFVAYFRFRASLKEKRRQTKVNAFATFQANFSQVYLKIYEVKPFNFFAALDNAVLYCKPESRKKLLELRKLVDTSDDLEKITATFYECQELLNKELN